VVLLGADVVQLNDVTALVAALDGALTGDLEVVSSSLSCCFEIGRHTVNQLTWWESTG
jgi:hypothetical protein